MALSEDLSELISHEELDLASECTIESASQPSDSGSYGAVNDKLFLGSPKDNNVTISAPHTPVHQPTRSLSATSCPSTPCKQPTALPSTPCVPTILCTPTFSAPSSTPGTPFPRSHLLSPRPLWQSGAARLTKTIRRAASFASFGEKSVTEGCDEGRRVSSEPALESPRHISEEDLLTPIMAVTEGQPDSQCFLQSDLPDGIPAPESSPKRRHPKPSTAELHEIRTSILSTGSELSAQWYRSPRERLGLFLTVTKRGAAPWERGVDEKTTPTANVAQVVVVGKKSWRTVLFGSLRRG